MEPTNSLAVTGNGIGIPKSFFRPELLDLMREHFETFGQINNWVPLSTFGRILVVYQQEADAESAKLQSDPIVIDQSEDRPELVLRVYRADPNPLLPTLDHLQLPETEKAFLISPPGSPPVGWEPVREEPPNASPLADDLMAALRKLQLTERKAGIEVIIEPDSEQGVGVYVEDCDGEPEVSDETWVYGQSAPARNRWQPTAMPPVSS
ncbi:hypothetical protein HMN09_00432700 [Mycena chlorophos]|uniref:Calcipressin n=1 Tax=Mycena chlorophos TaxID=658473 RepID=A0A8H6WJA7_MYCCL|nr:hypothetical protein HMN09_00432700 [Mycena chlorophos]